MSERVQERLHLMKPVYTLVDALAKDPARVAKTQALTLDRFRPRMGLKGSHGLFASEAWWESIEARINTARWRKIR